jgi:hypothetical protein
MFRLKKLTVILITEIVIFSAFFSVSAKAQVENYAVTINSPIEGAIITGKSVTLNCSVANMGVLLSTVRSIPFTVYLDGNFCAQGNMGADIKNAGFSVNSDLVLTNLTQGAHLLRIDVAILADSIGPKFKEMPDAPVQIYQDSATVNFTVTNQPTQPAQPIQPQQFSKIVLISGATVVLIIGAIMTVLFFKKREY